VILKNPPVERGYAAQGGTDSRPAFGAFERLIHNVRFV
jgi:hypothetical protein